MNEIKEKECYRCHKKLPFTQFNHGRNKANCDNCVKIKKDLELKGLKECCRCHFIKPFNEFFRRNNRNTYNPRCKKCDNIRKNNYLNYNVYYENDEQKCFCCGITKKIENFPRISGLGNRVRVKCRDCIKDKKSEIFEKDGTKYKICHKCKKEKEIINFYKNGLSVAHYCKDCHHKKLKKPKYIDEYENGAIIKRQCRACEKIKDVQEFYKSRKTYKRICKCCRNIKRNEIFKNLTPEQLVKHHEQEKNRLKKYRGNSKIKALCVSAKRRAKEQNVPFNITCEDIIIPEKCPILNIKLQTAIGLATDQSPSLDKIIPKLGYIKGNIKVISRRANRIKDNGSAEEHEKIADYIRENSPIQEDYSI